MIIILRKKKKTKTENKLCKHDMFSMVQTHVMFTINESLCNHVMRCLICHIWPLKSIK